MIAISIFGGKIDLQVGEAKKLEVQEA